MEKNQIKIRCNPYSNTISYQRWDGEEGWRNLSEKSRLMLEEKYQNTNLRHSAYDIIQIIHDEYDRGNYGLIINFYGTDDDYHDLCALVKQSFDHFDIECRRGKEKLISAKEAMPKINDIFGQLIDLMISAGSGSELTEILDRFTDVTTTTIPICITGTYSSGKSTFINAMLGMEVLPSGTDPTTSRIYKITRNDKQAKVTFEYDGIPVTLELDKGRHKISQCFNGDLAKKLERVLRENKNQAYDAKIFLALSEINTFANQANSPISPMIEVELPFRDSLLNDPRYHFVIYDTPGSNSASHEEHFEVLENCLKGQTNGLPIVVTTRTSMDGRDNEDLVKFLDKVSDNLDVSNAMVIVNQADNLSIYDFDDDELHHNATSIMKAWKSNRLYYVSSIVGLGSKKDNYKSKESWLDKRYQPTFKKSYAQFLPDDEDYMQLYKHNEIALDKRTKYEAFVHDQNTEKKLLYINSGLHCAEYEILDYAERIALYNKCNQAQEYLLEAIGLAENGINDIKQKQVKQCEKIRNELDSKKRELLNQLHSYEEQAKVEYVAQYPHYMVKCVEKHINSLLDEFVKSDVFDNLWKQAKREAHKTKKKKIDIFSSTAKTKTLSMEQRVWEELKEKSVQFIESKQEQMKMQCCRIVKENESLSTQEKVFISQFIMNLTVSKPELEYIPDLHSIRKKILGFELDAIDVRKVKIRYVGILKDDITQMTHRIRKAHISAFNNWSEQLDNGLCSKIATLNPKLREMVEAKTNAEQQIQKLQNNIYTLRTAQGQVLDVLDFSAEQ